MEKITYATALQDSRVKYAVSTGMIDDMNVQEVVDFLDNLERKSHKPSRKHATPRRHPCKNPNGCDGEMYFDKFTTLRPGRKDKKQVAVYVCFRCEYAVMEDV